MTWFNTNYLYKKQLIIEHSKVSGGSDISNFPVLISLTDANLATVAHSGYVQNANGYDIIFTDSAEAVQLYHEIESYTASNGTLVFWVNVPVVSASQDTVVYVYFGNSAISTFQSTASSVWDGNYKAVYHLGGSSPSVADSTSNANNGTNYGATAITGEIDGGAHFDGSSQYVSTNGAYLDGLSAMTAEFWVNLDSLPTNYFRLLGTNVQSGLNGFDIYFNNSSQLGGIFGDGTAIKYAAFATVTSGSWIHYVWVYNGSTVSVYKNGVFVASTSWAGPLGSSVSALTLGKSGSSTYMPGILDEVRISQSARSAGWVTTSYNNQNNPSAFFSIGSLQTYSAPSAHVIICDGLGGVFT